MSHKLKKISGTYTPDKDILKENPRIRIVESVNIDYDCFRKTDDEKLILKLAKVMAKRGIEYERKSYKRSKAQRIAYRQKQLRLLSEAHGSFGSDVDDYVSDLLPPPGDL